MKNKLFTLNNESFNDLQKYLNERVRIAAQLVSDGRRCWLRAIDNPRRTPLISLAVPGLGHELVQRDFTIVKSGWPLAQVDRIEISGVVKATSDELHPYLLSDVTDLLVQTEDGWIKIDLNTLGTLSEIDLRRIDGYNSEAEKIAVRDHILAMRTFTGVQMLPTESD